MNNLFLLALPVVITLNLLLGLVVFLTHWRRLANRVFAALSLIIALWLGCQLCGSLVTSERWLVFWIRQSCAMSAVMLLFFHLLRDAVAQPDKTLSHLLRRSWRWLAAVVAVVALVQTDFFLVGARFPESDTQIAEPLYGPGFSLFVAFWVVTVAALVWHFQRALARTQGVFRLELQIMALGSFFALVPGVVLILVIPLISGSSQSARLTPLTVAVWHGVIAYGIATRHIMGVGEFLRRTITAALLAVFLAALYLLVYQLMIRLPLGARAAFQQTFAHVAAAVAVALTLAPADAFLQQGATRLFDTRDGLANLLQRGGELARTLTTVDALLHDFSRLLHRSLNLAHVRVYLRADERFVLHTRFGSVRAAPSVGETDPLLAALRAERRPLLRDVLRRSGGTQAQRQAEQALTRFDAEAAVGLPAKKGLAGFLLLGRQLNGRVFGRREEDALLFLGDQLGIALENATLYTRLSETGQYNEVLLDNLVTGVVAADIEGRATVCNREARRILRLPENEPALGRPADAFLPAPMWEAMHACLISDKAVRDQDLVLETRGQDEQSVRFATARFGETRAAASGVLLVIQDTSALRKLEEQIRRSDRLASIGTLAAGMAHEIKNPLVCLKTFVQLLPTRYDDPDFRNTFMPLLGGEVERINTIVSQLLNLSRPVKPNLVPVSLHAVLDAAWRLAAQSDKAKGVRLARRFEADHDQLLGDSRLLGQVFLNLFLNGIDAMERGGTLTVWTRVAERPTRPWPRSPLEPAAWIEVRVSDTGCGIPPEDRQRVFDPFYSTKAQGTGLGLAVAHGIVLEHQGLIDVESAPEQGACFRVSLPLLVPAGGERKGMA